MHGLKLRFHRIPVIMFLISLTLTVSGQEDAVSMADGFREPPESALPRTWWHWTNSNITKEGITKDLEWMKRVGIGGMHLADVAAGQGQTVENKILFRSPEWFDAVRHTASEAERLGLEMTIFSSAGWSLTGGPWVKPEQAMKKLVWSEINLNGPLSFAGKLPDPPSFEGQIRNHSNSPKPVPVYYKDCVVLAFPTPPEETEAAPKAPAATTGSGDIDPSALLDDDLNSSVKISSGKGKKGIWIQYAYEEPVTARALTMANRAGIPVGKILAGNNETDFRTVALFPGAQLYRAGKVATFSFPAVTAKYFRIEFTGAPMRPDDVMKEIINPPDTAYTFSEIKLHSGPRIHRWEDKAGFYHLFNYDPVESGDLVPGTGIDPESVIDLTAMMTEDGQLNWKVPAGNWTVMRFGYSLTGARNRPSVPAGSGYEVDKLSREHTTAYLKAYTEPLAAALGPLYGKTLRSVMLDSWEAGMQNWTDNMLTEFKNRRGYDLKPFLPSLSGRVMKNADVSDRVLWDFRRTLADMFAENHYAVLTEFLNKQGILTYGEASGVSLEILEDALLCKKYVDIPMGEFWYRALHPELMYYQDVRGAASASHVYGKKLVAAEAFTGGGYESPNTLKKIGDYWFAQGINRFVFHTSAHQPLDTKPGNTMVGTHINRNITWADQAGPFMKYLARNSFMLQQGKFVADLAFLLDEGAPSTMPLWGTGLVPAPPEGYDFDYINADVLLNRISVSEAGKLVLPDGMSYSVLVLPNTEKMTLHVLKKINELVKAGATVIGPRPQETPGYSGYPGDNEVFRNLADELWADLDGISRTNRLAGKGRVFWGTPVSLVLEKLGVEPDVEYSKPLDSKINWIHRSARDADFYFIVNSSEKKLDTEFRFRVAGMEAEIWDPITGLITPCGYKISDKSTIVPLSLEPGKSLFAVFRKKAGSNEIPASGASYGLLATLSGPWEVAFPAGMGAPEKAVFNNLESWTTSENEGIMYFSGTAAYKKTFKIPGAWLKPGMKLFLDLGDVADMAEVFINGTNAGLIWTNPFRTEITGLVRKGTNVVEVRVTNQWTNRLIGDQKATAGNKILNSQVMIWGRNPAESGLLGPVTILKSTE
ncbi:MAG: glycosyl hydrolase [Bacteroidales bacterium]|jgi:hypothetical protein|nr:glycosyl hydrolase [Bacteroidales bacterium]